MHPPGQARETHNSCMINRRNRSIGGSHVPDHAAAAGDFSRRRRTRAVPQQPQSSCRSRSPRPAPDSISSSARSASGCSTASASGWRSTPTARRCCRRRSASWTTPASSNPGRACSSAFELRLHASTTVGNYLVPRLLAGFRRECPLGRVEARIGNTLEVIRAVQDFSADLGLIEGPCQESGLVVSPWILDELVVVAAPAHPLARAAKRRPLTIAQLAAGPWLLREEGSGTREAVDLAVLPHIHSFGEARILGGSEAIKNAAAFGLGVSCLSRWVVDDLVRARRLVILDTRLPLLKRRLSIIWHREKTLVGGPQPVHRALPGARSRLASRRSADLSQGLLEVADQVGDILDAGRISHETFRECRPPRAPRRCIRRGSSPTADRPRSRRSRDSPQGARARAWAERP